MKRRDFLKSVGLLTAGAAIAPDALASNAGMPMGDVFNPETGVPGDLNTADLGIRSLTPRISRKLTVAVIGAGNRGSVYAKYCLNYPDLVQVVAVSDLNEYRRKAFAKRHNIPAERCFGDYNDFLAAGKMADAVIIATPDNHHYVPCMKALAMGYDVLLEKPGAQTEKECRDLLAQAKKYNRILALCHVMRYAPYFIAMRAILRKGEIGDIVSIQHLEPIQYAHMAHSYVRGNWHNSKNTTPIILAKSCHDLDMLRWLIDKPCKTISADGSIYLFKEENAPKGAPARCTDGCPYESECPYSAIDIYTRKKRHTHVFDIPDRKDPVAVMEQLKKTDYGRCVYHMDNDQPDHYVANMVFEGGVTASFAMEAFTPHGGRRTRIMGTKGFIDGDSKQFTVTDFRSGKKKVWNMKVSEIEEYKGAGHGGGDYPLVRDFLEAVAAHDPGKLTSSIDASIESHIMGFAAEKSRKTGKKANVKL